MIKSSIIYIKHHLNCLKNIKPFSEEISYLLVIKKSLYSNRTIDFVSELSNKSRKLL